MKMPIYSIRDRKTEQHTLPQVVVHEAVIKRQLGIVVNDKKSLLCRYPEDYELISHGFFDTDDGTIHDSAPTFVCCLTELIDPSKRHEMTVDEAAASQEHQNALRDELERERKK